MHETPVHSIVEDDPAYEEELRRLFNLYRLANLNARYYGKRAENFERWNRAALITMGGLSAAAFITILVSPTSRIATVAVAVLTGVAGAISGILPFLGWSEKIRDLRNQHFAYTQLFAQVELLITEIRRANKISAESLGAAKLVHDAYSRVEAGDELEPNQSTLDGERKKVDLAIPPDYLWTHF